MQFLPSRRIGFRNGQTAWVVSRPPYMAPLGLADGQRVTIISAVVGQCMVRDADGRDWPLSYSNLDPGSEYQGKDGKWYPESDPRVLERLARDVETLKVERWQGPIEDVRRDLIARMRHVLERNRGVVIGRVATNFPGIVQENAGSGDAS